MSTLGITGKAGFTQMAAAGQAGEVRQFLLSGRIANMTLAAGADRDRQVLGLVGGRYPRAVATFGRPALLALTRSLGRNTCSWCAASVIAAGLLEPAPDLDSAAHQALLGSPCRSCLNRQQAAKSYDQEVEHIAAVEAAGLHASAAGRIRDPGSARQLAAEIETLRQAGPGPGAVALLSVRDSINLARARQRQREALRR